MKQMAYLSKVINTQEDLYLFGRWLQQQGFWVWEHSRFFKFGYGPTGTYRIIPGAHNPRSFHLHDMALDVNFPNTAQERAKIINIVIPMCQRLGFSYIYAHYGTYGSAKNHQGHIHIDTGSSTNNGARYITTPNKNVNVAAILGMDGKKRKPNTVYANTKSANPALTQTVQRISNHFGYTAPALQVDGKFGAKTEYAVRKWQQALGKVAVDGKLGPATVRRYYERVGTMKQGSRGLQVVLWQYIVGVKRDGVFGEATAKATMECQRWAGITADGVVGKDSRNKLIR